MSRRRVVLITGCSSGFGYLTAKLLAENGDSVYGTVRKQKDLKVFAGIPVGKRPKAVMLDVTWSQERINRVVGIIAKKEKRIDVLVNNAGVGFMGAVGLFSVEEVREQYETNIFGLFKVTKSVLLLMERQKSGLIINISSAAGLFATAYYGVYSSSKFAVEALTSALRAEESLLGIHVVSVNPGTFETKFGMNERTPKVDLATGNFPTGKLTKRLRGLVLKGRRFQGNPMVVAKKIKQITETKNPKKNYIVGTEAMLLYWVSRFFPQSLLDWLIKKVVKRLA